MSLDVLPGSTRSPRVVFRHRSVWDVFDLALRFLFVHRVRYLKVGLVVTLPSALTTIAIASTFGWVAGWLATIGGLLLTQSAYTVLAARLVFDEDVAIAAVLKSALRDAPRTVFASVVVLLLVALGLFFFVVPGLMVGSALFFLLEVMLLERASIGKAFSRAQRIASGSYGEALGAMFVAGLLLVLGTVLADFSGRAFVGDLLQFRPPKPFWVEGGSVLTVFGAYVTLPYVVTARFLGYLNVRTRVEGWDIQTRFAALARSYSAPHDGADASGPHSAASHSGHTRQPSSARDAAA